MFISKHTGFSSAKLHSPEIEVRNFLVKYIKLNYGLEVDRESFVLLGDVLSVRTSPILKKKLLSDWEKIKSILVKEEYSFVPKRIT